MFILRNATNNDIESLYQLSSHVTFINLPHDLDYITKLIDNSTDSFTTPSDNLHENHYVFILEDLEKSHIAGVSIIHAQHGHAAEPHFYLKVDKEEKYSETISTGFIHGTLKLGLDYNGPTEIGGLVIDPAYRGHKDKLGKQISFSRFLYMGINPNRFRDEVHSELMPPLDNDGNSPLWEAIGRRFMNMDYQEADILSRNNKEFILNLFPENIIYTTLLPVEARNAIGKVGPDTVPVESMLSKIGFKYIDEVDPFDGGPHYRCNLKNIKPIKSMIHNYTLSVEEEEEEEESDHAQEFVMIAVDHPNYDFYAFSYHAAIDHQHKKVIIDNDKFKKFNDTNVHAIYLGNSK